MMNIIEAIGRQLENIKCRIQTDIEYSGRLLAGNVGAHQCVFFHSTFLVDMTGQLVHTFPDSVWIKTMEQNSPTNL